jgi:hypothetical protein
MRLADALDNVPLSSAVGGSPSRLSNTGDVGQGPVVSVGDGPGDIFGLCGQHPAAIAIPRPGDVGTELGSCGAR